MLNEGKLPEEAVKILPAAIVQQYTTMVSGL